jgi:hypothetical protein
MSKIKLQGKFVNLGSFDDEGEAARVYDASAAPLGMQLNFAQSHSVLPDKKQRARSKIQNFVVKSSLARNACSTVDSQHEASKDTNISLRYKGVSCYSQRNKCLVRFTNDGTRTHVGLFDDKDEAKRKCDEAAALLEKGLKLPGDAHSSEAVKMQRARSKVNGFVRRFNVSCEVEDEDGILANYTAEGQPACAEGGRRGGSSKYKGVSWYGRCSKWKVEITVDSRRVHLGYFDDEGQAARKYDEAAAPLKKPVNFPAEGQVEAAKIESSAKYTGVCLTSRGKKWTAGIYIDSKQTHLGYFDNEDEAGHRYDKSAESLGRSLNFPEASPVESSAPSLEAASVETSPGAQIGGSSYEVVSRKRKTIEAEKDKEGVMAGPERAGKEPAGVH